MPITLLIPVDLVSVFSLFSLVRCPCVDESSFLDFKGVFLVILPTSATFIRLKVFWLVTLASLAALLVFVLNALVYE